MVVEMEIWEGLCQGLVVVVALANSLSSQEATLIISRSQSVRGCNVW